MRGQPKLDCRSSPSERPTEPSHPMDQEREQQRRTYQLCRLGFGLLSFALLVACVTSVLGILGALFRPAPNSLDHPDPALALGAMCRSSGAAWWGRTCSGAVGPTPVGSGGADSSLMMCCCDAVLWFLEHGGELGLRLARGRTRMAADGDRPGPGLGALP